MTELEKWNIDYEDKKNKCELVARLRKNIGEETQRNQINETKTIKDKVGIAANAPEKYMTSN